MPSIRDRGWPTNSIDWFTLARLEQEGFQPAPRAAKERLIRRLSFDLTGLPPTLAEIDEFLDDISGGQLLPDDPLLRAQNRSWIEFGTACLLDLSAQLHAEDQQSFDSNRDALRSKLAWLETRLHQPPYFNGETLSLVDFSYAPLFMRAEILNIGEQLYPAAKLPKRLSQRRETQSNAMLVSPTH